MREDVAIAPSPAASRRRSAWVRVGLATAPIVALVALLGAGLRNGDASTARAGGPAPRFVVTEISTDTRITPRSLRGHVAVLNFWASWCRPCAAEAPSLAEAWSRTRSAGVRFVGISYQDDPASARRFADAHDVTWTLAEDRGATAAEAFGIVGVPETIVLSPSGRIVAHAVGPVSADRLLSWIDRAQGAAS